MRSARAAIRLPRCTAGSSRREIRDLERAMAAGRHHLIFVAPERLLTPRFLELAARLEVSSFAIDEAHCISQWGHDFRPEYRQLAELKTRFRNASLHAYTATATERVRRDIVEQLGLEDPTVLVGSFDRPNLLYRVVPKLDVNAQVADTLRRHRGEASIVYCITRKDTEQMARIPGSEGVRAAALSCRDGSRASAVARRIVSPPRKSTWWWRRLRSAWESIAATSAA